MSETPIKHITVSAPLFREDGGVFSVTNKILAQSVKDFDNFMINNVRDILVQNGFTDVYLLDETFIVDALKEYKERTAPEPLSVRRLYLYIGCPVWLSDIDPRWALVYLDDALDGQRREPFLSWMDADCCIHTSCARHFIASGGKIYPQKPRICPVRLESPEEGAQCED